MVQIDLEINEHRIGAAGLLYILLAKNKRLNPGTTFSLPIGTHGDKRSLHVKNQFKEALQRESLGATVEKEIGKQLIDVMSS